jgi:glutamate-1-semialdehyde 2,1-aminomutase
MFGQEPIGINLHRFANRAPGCERERDLMNDQNSADAALRRRARAVIPNGLWGHQSARLLPEGYPQFFARAGGCRLWDVDGREFIDMMCSWGPIILGHHHPVVEEAAERQARLGDCMNGPGAVLVDLAETFVDTVAHADWVELQKNGTDATTLCVTIARAHTQRRKILVARGTYHGASPMFSPSLVGVTAEDRAHVIFYEYNDVASLREAAASAKGDLAAVLVAAFRHDIRREQELPEQAFAEAVRALCDETGAVMVLDDVRAGFRLHRAGSWEPLGVRPDLSAFSKAIANGYALAAVVGAERFRKAAGDVYSTGSFWCESVPMAAGLATLQVLRSEDFVAHLEKIGTMFREGVARLAARRGLKLRQTGPVQMPMLSFQNDSDLRQANAFCSAAVNRGLYLHPWHNMFFSAAHREKDVEEALEIVDAALGVVANEVEPTR